MLAWFTETGFGYLLGVAAVTLIGLLLVYWGLWGDRSKGRVRCPKCWYDMRGTVPKLECPECGHDAGQERLLHNTRRRWGRTVVGVVLVLLSAYPLAIVGGYWREQAVLRRYGITAVTRPKCIASGPSGAPGVTVSIGPAWLVERLPDELARFFERIDYLDVDDPAQLAACQNLRRLRRLRIEGEQVTDADLVHLEGMTNLEELRLSDTRVTNAGLVHLKGLSKLKTLTLANTQITGAWFVHLKELSKLECIDLSGTQGTDAGLVHLKGLSRLKILKVWGTQVTDAGVAKLQRALPNVNIIR